MGNRIRNFVLALLAAGLSVLGFYGLKEFNFSSEVNTEVGVRGGDGGIPVPDWFFWIITFVMFVGSAIATIYQLWKVIKNK